MKFKWDKSYFGIGLTAFIVIACSILFFMLISRINMVFSGIVTFLNILMPVIVGLVIAYLLNPLLNFFERNCFKKIQPQLKYSKVRRGVSLLCTFVLVVLLLAGFFWLLIPQLVESITSLVKQIPGYLDTARVFLDGFLKDNETLQSIFNVNLSEFFANLQNTFRMLQDHLPSVSEILTGATQGVMGVVTALMNIFVGFVVAVYVLYSKERFAAQMKKVMFALLPRNFTLKTIDLLSQTDKMFSGYVFGKVVEALCVSALCLIGCTILDVPYALVVSVIMFVFNLIPYFGPLIGAIPCILLILFVDPIKALWFIILIVVLQQFDGNVIGPMILGNHTGLTSFWIIFSIFLFGGLFGFLGMIIGVPAFAVIYSLIRALVQKRLGRKGMPLSTRDYMKMESELPPDAIVIVEEQEKVQPKSLLFRYIKKNKTEKAEDDFTSER